MLAKRLLGAAMAAGLSIAASPILAEVTYVPVSADVSAAPFTHSFSVGSALTFDSDTTGFASVYGVETTGSTQVFSVFGTPSLFQPFATTLFPSEQLGAFSSFATSAAVPFSLASGTLGFKFTLADGDHFGLAKTDGSLIDALYIQDTPGADISLAVSPPAGGAVPEPASWALLVLGVGGIGALLRRSRRTGLVVT